MAPPPATTAPAAPRPRGNAAEMQAEIEGTRVEIGATAAGLALGRAAGRRR